MKNKPLYIVLFVLLLLVVLVMVSGNLANKKNEQSTDMTQSSFYSKDKKAGGAYAAFKMLPQLFMRNSVQVVTKPFARTFDKDSELKFRNNVYILVADKLFTTESDIDAMLDYVSRGNELFIAMNTPDPLLEKHLKFVTVESNNMQSKKEGIVQRYADETIPMDTSFSYPGMVSGNYFSAVDSNTTNILGYNYKNKPNFIRIEYRSGFIYLLLNPYTFTNYFLLHKQNVKALETQMSYLINDAGNVYWDDFYNSQHSAQSGDFSEWQVLMRYASMRWALWLAVVLMLLYVVFESKRRQRIIPDKPPVTNTSLEFVDAIGQLYYQQHNNYNLAYKMIIHFMEYIRSRYYLNTNVLNDEFIASLARKSLVPEGEIRALLQMVHHIQLEENISDDDLKDFYNRIQQFYINTNK
ncbi:DUF4350 domain-containing protein [Chitinophaga ginsengisegetis]|uniref:DUF4350 domain-containing protein n=1 Tax=Chitinophaga ginsengisegetis TaxID=393003 RepID=UPI000DBFC680|nr:DUF4350 domain-containing protein [Chitinophaga ginsengisegetis]MDR6566835.1 hypothetical protein [Chitinophaga ginsengisegetis]MDR6646565.1 hypothetical protein [Chitinophaga ginsengisegetis]MDR6652915.1 hypothetical protein [Chitinophaga ginsengisegetis]